MCATECLQENHVTKFCPHIWRYFGNIVNNMNTTAMTIILQNVCNVFQRYWLINIYTDSISNSLPVLFVYFPQAEHHLYDVTTSDQSVTDVQQITICAPKLCPERNVRNSGLRVLQVFCFDSIFCSVLTTLSRLYRHNENTSFFPVRCLDHS